MNRSALSSILTLATTLALAAPTLASAEDLDVSFTTPADCALSKVWTLEDMKAGAPRTVEAVSPDGRKLRIILSIEDGDAGAVATAEVYDVQTRLYGREHLKLLTTQSLELPDASRRSIRFKLNGYGGSDGADFTLGLALRDEAQATALPAPSCQPQS